MLRTNEQGELKKASAQDDLARRKAASRRTAWIVGALALAFFIASLVEGHLSHIPH